jgi:hypothetical protein
MYAEAGNNHNILWLASYPLSLSERVFEKYGLDLSFIESTGYGERRNNLSGKDLTHTAIDAVAYRPVFNGCSEYGAACRRVVGVFRAPA